MAALIVVVVLVLFALFVAARTVRIIPQAKAGVVARLGRYGRPRSPGPTHVVPLVRRGRPRAHRRAQGGRCRQGHARRGSALGAFERAQQRVEKFPVGQAAWTRLARPGGGKVGGAERGGQLAGEDRRGPRPAPTAARSEARAVPKWGQGWGRKGRPDGACG
mgnify:CR=1 FL=1